MTTPSADNAAREQCTSCGASLAPFVERCWMCGVPLAGDGMVPTSSAEKLADVAKRDDANSPGRRARAQSRRATVHFQFGLASLMLTITLISVCLGVASLSPPLGIGLIILATPAFLRTAIAARRLRQLFPR